MQFDRDSAVAGQTSKPQNFSSGSAGVHCTSYKPLGLVSILISVEGCDTMVEVLVSSGDNVLLGSTGYPRQAACWILLIDE